MKPTLANIGSPASPKSVMDHYFYPPDGMRAVRGEGIYRSDEDRRLSLGYSHSEIVWAVAA